MKVRIGAIEISDVSMDDLDEIIKRYGSLVQSETGEHVPAGNGSAGSGAKSATGAGHGAASRDMVILRKLIDAGTQGVATATMGEMLGRRGKATWGAARDWATRVGITTEGDDMDPFEETRVGTQRGMRIKPSLLDIAKAHLTK